MAYTVPWDEASPDGAITPAADIDVELQNLKTSVAERLEDVIPDWRDDLVDPKVLAPYVIDNSSVWALYEFTGAQGIRSDGVPVIIPLNDQLTVGGDGVWGNVGGRIITPLAGAYLFITVAKYSCYAPVSGTIQLQWVAGGVGGSGYAGSSQVAYVNTNAAVSARVQGMATSINAIKDWATAAEFELVCQNSSGIGSGLFSIDGVTVYAMRVGA